MNTQSSNLQWSISGSGSVEGSDDTGEVMLFTELAEKRRGIKEGSEDNKARRFNGMN